MDISVLIVNYNGANVILNCIESILSQVDVTFEVIMVDNASQDNSLVLLERYAQSIRLITSASNLGFGKANNAAFAVAQGRYVFLLNPDATLQTPQDLKHILAFMDKHPAYGLAGTRLVDPTGRQATYPKKTYPGQAKNAHAFTKLPGQIAWVLGACQIIRYELFAALQGFDEDYFLYGEDIDICLRVRQQGFAIGFIANVCLTHIGGASEKNNNPYAIWCKKQIGLHTFFSKHYPSIHATKVVKLDLKRAAFRLFWLTLKNKWIGLNADEQAKYAKYQAIYTTSKQFLARQRKPK